MMKSARRSCEAQNFRILRFWNGVVLSEREFVLETIVWAITHPEWRQDRDPLPQPSPCGGGSMKLIALPRRGRVREGERRQP